MAHARSNSSLTVSQISADGKIVRLVAHLSGASVVCPTCHHASTRIHDHHVRRPMDLPWRGYTVRVTLTVRRFRCLIRDCWRATFTESLGEDLPKHARRTAAATETLVDLARADGAKMERRAPIGLACRRVRILSCACCVGAIARTFRPRGSWWSMISPCAVGRAMPRCWSTSNRTSPSTSGKGETPRSWPSGFRNTWE